MTTWVADASQFIGYLTGFDGRDAFAKRRRFPAAPPRATPVVDLAETEEREPLEAQDEVLELVYDVLGVLRRTLTDGADGGFPSATALLDMPKAAKLFSAVTKSMFEADRSPERTSAKAGMVLLQCAVKGLVTAAYTERIRREFVVELTCSLEALAAQLAQERATSDDWRDDIDGGVVLYDVFRPKLWEVYRRIWGLWQKDMARVQAEVAHLVQVDEAVTKGMTDT